MTPAAPRTHVHPRSGQDRLFAGPGAARAQARSCDWAATELGPVETWSPALRAAIRLMLDASSPMVVYAGPSFVTLYNDAYCSVLRAKHPDAFGRPAAEVWAELWPEVSAQFRLVRDERQSLNLQAVPYTIARSADGSPETAWFDYALSPVRDDDTEDAPGAVVAVFKVVSEITARAAAEKAIAGEREKLRSLILHMPIAMALHLGPEHRYDIVNEAYESTAGRSGLVGQTPREAFPEFAGAGFFELLDHAYATGEPWLGPENHVPLQLPDGSTRDLWTTVRIEPVRDDDGRVIGILNLSIDITAQVLARREVQELLIVAESARADAVAANRSKSEFLAIMSHELRTPLNAIDGYAELIELGIRGPITEEQRQDLARIRKSQKHLLGLINGVLNYARVEAGAVHYHLEAVAVEEVLASCEALTMPQVRNRRLMLNRQPCSPTLHARADREKLQQVVLNLLSNAIKFTDAGGRIEVRCALGSDERGALVHIIVSDTGIGIAPHQLSRVFEPFVQVDAELTRTREGTGLGLAISRDLARGMGGELTAESTLGAGSTFTLTLRAELPAA